MGSTYAAIGPQPQAGGRHALQWIRPKYRFGFAAGRNAANRSKCYLLCLLTYLLRQLLADS